MKKALFTKSLFLAGAISLGVFAEQVQAIVTGPIGFGSLDSHVTDDVVDNGGGNWTYNFTVYNDTVPNIELEVSNSIVDWELPYFDDMGITNIQSPAGWDYAIETIGQPNQATGWQGVADWQMPGDPWKIFFDGFYGSEAANPFNSHNKVLHWYCIGIYVDDCSAIFPGESQSGFSFDAGFAEGQAPYQASWDNLQVQTGDPAFPDGAIVSLPNSPSINPVPLPGAWMLLITGFAGMTVVRKKKL